jgi:Domain of unknown function (DUF4292)
MQRPTLIFIFVLALLTQSCTKRVVPVLPLPPKTLAIEEIDFEYLHGKAHLNFKDEKKQFDVKAHIRIRKDSVIWMTFSVIGVQGGKALINRDSITIVSTVDKEYYVFDYGELSKRFNFKIDYAVVQAAMLGNLIMPRAEGDQIVEEADFNKLTQDQGTFQIKNFINRNTKKLEKLELTEGTSGNSIRIEYSNFQPLGNKSFPYTGTISVQYKTAAGIINNTITFEYNKAEVGDKELRFPFNIPKRYERR